MPTERVTILSPRGHELSGALELPTGLVRGVALFAHCFTCTKNSKAAVHVARALAREGIACLRFDFTGLGGSEGDFGAAGFATDVGDLLAAADWLADRFDTQVLLIGHSLGGAAVLAAAPRFARTAAVATIGAPSDVPHVLQAIEGDLAGIEKTGEGEVNIGGQPFAISRAFLDATRETDLLKIVGSMREPLLILHSPVDQQVGVDHAARLFEAAFHPKSFISLDRADHLLLDEGEARFAAQMIAAWAARYLPERAGLEAPEEGVMVATGHGKFGTEVQTVSHRFVADEPASYGGDNTGPTPYDLLLAALGTCTAMTIKMYADRKELRFEGTTIHLRHERDHGEDMSHALDESEPVQALFREIALHGDLSEEQRTKLLEIADKCPVHRTLEGHLHIHTEGVEYSAFKKCAPSNGGWLNAESSEK